MENRWWTITWSHCTSCCLHRTKGTGSWTVRWDNGWPQSSLSSQMSLCSKCFCGSCCSACLWNWSLDFPSSSSRSFIGSMRDSVAQLLVNLGSWALTPSSIQTVSLCWELSLQSSWRERWVTDLLQTDEVIANVIYSLMPGNLKLQLSIINKIGIHGVCFSPLDGNCGLMVSNNGKCLMWNVKRETLHSIEMIHWKSAVQQVAFFICSNKILILMWMSLCCFHLLIRPL